jgi:hypothetical protein
MFRTLTYAIIAVLFLARPLAAFEAVGTIQKVDAVAGVLVIHAGNQDRTVKVVDDVKILDTSGKPLPDGLNAKELSSGAEVTFTIEMQNGVPTVKGIQLGKQRSRSEPLSTGGKESIGLKPLTEMTAEDRYKGEDGGLYGGGKNEPPLALVAAAKRATADVKPLDAEGKPSADGVIGLVSISMSNATQEFSYFKQIADKDSAKSRRVIIVDCAQGGQAMAEWVSPRAAAWAEADRRLAAAHVSPKQVQVAWIKLANKGPTGDLAEHGKKLEQDTQAVLQNAKSRFPNLQIAYLGSRIYGGYSTGPLNPEPYAYEGAFAVRWLIRDQMQRSAELNFDPTHGAVKAPLLLWGPYLWADGVVPRRADGLVWQRADLGPDGTHPSQSGREKVATMLLKFFKSDTLAKIWFTKS